MTEVYRLRTVNQLLGCKYNELEQQTIFFASPDQLNDPMEGYRDIVWRGDEIAWTNLFRHFVYSLQRAYYLFALDGDRSEIDPRRICLTGRWDETQHQQFDSFLDETWGRIRSELRLSDLIGIIATKRTKVRSNELLFYLTNLHSECLRVIHNAYVERGFLPELNHTQDDYCMGGRDKIDHNSLIELLSKIDRELEGVAEQMMSVSLQLMAGMQLSYMLNRHREVSETTERNRRLLLVDFPQTYVRQLDKVLWPEWYTACFSKSYHNSSLWGSYADGHKGVCLIFHVEESDRGHTLALKSSTGRPQGLWEPDRMRFYDIEYTEKRREIDFFENIGKLTKNELMATWYTDDGGTVSKSASHIKCESELVSCP